MPQVPYKGYPEGGPENVPLRVEPPSGLLSGARAITKAGGDIAGAGDEVFRTAVQLRQLDIEAEVNKAVSDSIVATGKLDNDFRLLEGKDAQDKLEQHVQSLRSVRESYRNSLSSPYAQKQFDRETMRRMGYDIVNAGNYAATQLKQYDRGTRDAAESAITDNLMSDPRNKQKREDFKKSIDAIEDKDSELSGIQDPALKEKKRKDKFGPNVNKVAKAMANTDPEEAMNFLEEMKPRMHGADYEVALDEVRKRSLGVWAKREGDQISRQADLTKDMSLADLHKAAEDAASKLSIEHKLDPVSEVTLKNGIISNIDNNSNRMKKEQADRNRALYGDIGQVMNRPTPTGRNPISMQEANAVDPRFQDKVEEYSKANPKFAQTLQNWFAANAKQSPPWTPERQATYAKFLGATDEERMAYNPAQMLNDGLITRDSMNSMLDKQAGIERKVKMGQAIDPILLRHHQERIDAEAYPSTTNLRANERYKWLKGAAELRMLDHESKFHAPMNIKDQDEMMKSLLQEVVTGKYDFYNPMRLFGEGPTDRRFVVEGQTPTTVNSQEDYAKVPKGAYYYYNGKLAGPKQ